MLCPQCGSPIVDDMRFCAICGATLQNSVPAYQIAPQTDFPTPAKSPTPVSTARKPYVGEVPLNNFAENKRKPILIVAASCFLLVITLSASFFLLGRTSDEQSVSNPSSETNSNNQLTPPEGMVYVPGGQFLMGSDSGDEYERPAHNVTVKPYFIDTFEVTCQDYKSFIDASGHRLPPGWDNGTFPDGFARRPVTGVNWDDAVAYAIWSNKRLPTEEEWEFAARGTDGRIYPWGNEWKEGMANANKVNSGMVDVGTYKDGHSPFGSYDMVGNAWEWTSSIAKAYPAGKTPPSKTSDQKVIRGGFWGSSVSKGNATTTFRGWYGARSEDNYENTSIRCVRDAPSQ